MTPPWIEGANWLEGIPGRFAAEVGPIPFSRSAWADPRTRAALVARGRWALLAILGLYGLFAGGVFSVSAYGFFLSRSQLGFLVASVAGVALCNLLFQAGRLQAREWRFLHHFQILLDLFIMTVLIHLSGGASSWFWPAYLIVTIEAAFLLPNTREVWAAGAAGGIMYGLLLAGHYKGLLPPVRMPFVVDSLNRNGFYLGLLWSWVAILNAAVAFISGYLMSIIRREHRALLSREAQLQQFLDSANDLIVCLTPEGRFLYVNPLWMKVMGRGLQALESTTFFDLVDLEDRTRVLKEFRRAMLEARGTSIEAAFLGPGGAPVSVEGHLAPTLHHGRPLMAWCICRDVTVRKQAEAQLFHLAHFDALTGLPNRASLMERLERAQIECLQSGHRLAILFVDLDRFKLINDTLGHAVGDELLQEVSRRFQSVLRESDLVCRTGGDEFVVALTRLQDQKEIATLAARLLKPLARPFQVGPHEIYVTASVGIGVFPEDDGELEALVKKADIAMYHAKSRGRNNYQFYNPRMDEHMERRLVLLAGLRRALEAGEFRVLYQPKVDVASGRITAMEALARWDHPELGMIGPSEFVPLAEESGLIFALGEWVLREACRQAVAWQALGHPPVRMGVNLSGYQLQQPGMARTVLGILEETGLAPEWLELEITETVLMQSPTLAIGVLEEIRGLGIHVSIDDFGTGYSSLAQLKRFSVNTLKIDKSFIQDLEHNPADAAIATAIIAMGACLNLQVVAEGVETEGQLTFLQGKACQGAQGFLFCGPVGPEEAAGQLLARGVDSGIGASAAAGRLHEGEAVLG